MDRELITSLRWVAASLLFAAGLAVIALNFVWRARARRPHPERRSGPSLVPLVAPILVAMGAAVCPARYGWSIVVAALILDPGTRVLWLALRR